MISLRLNADTSDAVRNVNNLGNSIEDLQRKLKAAQDNGNWSEAAKITQNIAFMQNPGFSVVGGSNGGNGSNLQNTTLYNNARQLDIRLETITRVITTLTDQLKESTEKGQSRESFNISAALNNAEQEKRQLEAEKKRLENADKNDSSVMDMIKKYGVTRYMTQGLNYANQIAGIGFNHRIAMANGDYLGADVSAVESGAGIAQGLGGSMLGAGMMLGATPVGWGLMAAGGIAEVVGAIAKYWAGDTRADIAEGEAYRKTLAGTNALNKRFSDGGTWLENSNKTDAILRAATSGANGTGLSTEEFLSLATRQSKFGGTQTDAMAQARDIAMWAQATGTDAGVIQNFLGTARRYGDNSDVLGYASQARQAAGLTKAQNEEFLQSLQSVIEDGIANGYVKSAEDVSKTFVMFSRLSNNNPLWQGEQGAKRLAQMNSGISSATALQSVSDVIVAGAAHEILAGKSKEQRNALLGGLSTGTYIDEMLLMEQGTNPAMFAEVAKSIQDIEGENIAGQIERYKDVYKLNYAGAVDVYNMALKMLNGNMTEETFSEAISAMQQDKQYQSEEVKWQNNINEIDKNVALMAQSKFWESLGKLDSVAGKTDNPTNSGVVSTKTTETINSSASSKEIADRANARAGHYLEKIDAETADLPVQMNLSTALSSQLLSEEGDYIGAVRAVLTPEKIMNMMTLGQINGRFDDSNIAFNLAYDTYGNEKLDTLFMKRLGDYAAKGYKSGLRVFGGHEADGKVYEREIVAAINAANKNEKLGNAYKNNDIEVFTSTMENMFEKLFGKIIVVREE